MTLPQSGRLDGGEQPQGLPGQPAESSSDGGRFLLAQSVERLFGQKVTPGLTGKRLGSCGMTSGLKLGSFQ